MANSPPRISQLRPNGAEKTERPPAACGSTQSSTLPLTSFHLTASCGHNFRGCLRVATCRSIQWQDFFNPIHRGRDGFQQSFSKSDDCRKCARAHSADLSRGGGTSAFPENGDDFGTELVDGCHFLATHIHRSGQIGVHQPPCAPSTDSATILRIGDFALTRGGNLLSSSGRKYRPGQDIVKACDSDGQS